MEITDRLCVEDESAIKKKRKDRAMEGMVIGIRKELKGN